MRKWQIQEAKAHFSQRVREAAVEGPQYITHRDKQVAVFMSQKEYDHLTQAKLSLIEFLRKSPLMRGLKLDREHDRSLSRYTALNYGLSFVTQNVQDFQLPF